MKNGGGGGGDKPLKRSPGGKWGGGWGWGGLTPSPVFFWWPLAPSPWAGRGGGARHTAKKVPGRNMRVRMVMECIDTVSCFVLMAMRSITLAESWALWAKYSPVRMLRY